VLLGHNLGNLTLWVYCYGDEIRGGDYENKYFLREGEEGRKKKRSSSRRKGCFCFNQISVTIFY